MKIVTVLNRNLVYTHAIRTRVLLVCASCLLASCSSVLRKESPTLSHVHIGHAITAWESAPNNQGLLSAAELYGIEAKANSDLMLAAAENSDKNGIKQYLSALTSTLGPSVADTDSTNVFGLRRLLAESLVHLKIASEIFDASLNVRRSMAELSVKGQQIVDATDELEVFIEYALESDDINELKIFAEEIASLVSKVTGLPAESSRYGIHQFRQDIDAMIAREDPPYQTISKFYLFSIGI